MLAVQFGYLTPETRITKLSPGNRYLKHVVPPLSRAMTRVVVGATHLGLVTGCAATGSVTCTEKLVLFHPHATPPPPHYHPLQEEHFHILHGAIHTVIGGQMRIYGPGEAFIVPPGVADAMHNLNQVRW
jgi:quercetin dioxygenase-like cupin family protein